MTSKADAVQAMRPYDFRHFVRQFLIVATVPRAGNAGRQAAITGASVRRLTMPSDVIWNSRISTLWLLRRILMTIIILRIWPLMET